jgi:hypothetical protein
VQAMTYADGSIGIPRDPRLQAKPGPFFVLAEIIAQMAPALIGATIGEAMTLAANALFRHSARTTGSRGHV